MQPLYASEGRLWFSLCSSEQPPMQDQRLSDEQHHHEQQPHDHHGMHPPVAGGQKAVPQIETDQHVQPGESRKRRRDPSLPGKAPLDGIEEGQPVLG
jgi:hypothetical protein